MTVFVNFDAGKGEGAESRDWVVGGRGRGSECGRGGDVGDYRGGVHEFFQVLEGVIFELLKVEVGFVPDRDPIADYVWSFGGYRGV